MIWGAGTSFLVEKIQRLAMVRCPGGIYGGGDVGRLLWCLLLWVWSLAESDWFEYGGERMRELLVLIAINDDGGCGGKRRWQENRCCSSLVWPVVDSGGAADVDTWQWRRFWIFLISERFDPDRTEPVRFGTGQIFQKLKNLARLDFLAQTEPGFEHP